MMSLGDFAVGATVYGKWNTNGANGASITRGTDGTLKIYKDNATAERSSAAGITDTEDFDSRTGVHHFTIDLSDNTDAGFYAAGHEYFVYITGAVIDSQTVNACIAHFSIERAGFATVQDLLDAMGSEPATDHVDSGSWGEKWNSIAAAPSTSDIATAVAATELTVGSFTAAALALFFTLDTTKVYADAIAGSVVQELAENVARYTTDEIADGVLARDFGLVSGAAARSALNALRKLRNKVTYAAPTLTVMKEDDTTQAYTQAVGTDPAQPPFKSLG